MFFVNFPYGVSSQVWYLIVSIPVWSRIVFLPGVQCSSSEFGERTVPNPGLEFGLTLPCPGSAVLEFGEKTGLNPGSAGSEKGASRTLIWQIRSSEEEPG